MQTTEFLLAMGMREREVSFLFLSSREERQRNTRKLEADDGHTLDMYTKSKNRKFPARPRQPIDHNITYFFILQKILDANTTSTSIV